MTVIDVPQSLEATFAQANYFYEIGRYREAKERYMQVLAALPQAGQLYYKIAYCEFHLRDIPTAIEHCKQAMEYGCKSLGTYDLLGLLYRLNGQNDLAEQALLEGLAEYPHSAGLHAQYAYLNWVVGRRSEARDIMADALRIDPSNHLALYYQFYMQQGLFGRKKRSSLLHHLIHSDRSEVNQLLLIADHLLMGKKFKSARAKAREAFILDPTNPVVVKKLDNLEMLCHPIMFPIRFRSRFGRPFSLLGTTAILISLVGFEAEIPTLIVMGIYALFIAWSLAARQMYEFVKRRWHR